MGPAKTTHVRYEKLTLDRYEPKGNGAEKGFDLSKLDPPKQSDEETSRGFGTPQEDINISLPPAAQATKKCIKGISQYAEKLLASDTNNDSELRDKEKAHPKAYTSVPPNSFFIAGMRGSGKTSCLKLLKNYFEGSDWVKKDIGARGWLPIFINPWQIKPDSQEPHSFADILFHFIKEKVQAIISRNKQADAEIIEIISKTLAEHIKQRLTTGQIPPSKIDDLVNEVSKAANQLVIGREEAAQAAVAFSDGPDDFPKTFADKLSGLSAWERFSKNLAELLKQLNLFLIVLVDDADLFHQCSLQIMRATAHLREIPRVVTVVAGDRDRLNALIIDEYQLKEMPPLSATEMRNLHWALGGEEIPLYNWSQRIKATFLADVKPVKEGNHVGPSSVILDGQYIWSWYLIQVGTHDKPSTDRNYEKKLFDEFFEEIPNPLITFHDNNNSGEKYCRCCHCRAHRALIWAVLLADAHAHETEPSAIVRDYVVQYNEYLKNTQFDLRQIPDSLWAMAKYLTTHQTSRTQLEIEFYKALFFYLFPHNPREAVFLTNLLINQRENLASIPWTLDIPFLAEDDSSSTRYDIESYPLCARRAKLLICMAWNKYSTEAFGQLLWRYQWNFYWFVTKKNIETWNATRMLNTFSEQAKKNFLQPTIVLLSKQAAEQIDPTTLDGLIKEILVQLLARQYKEMHELLQKRKEPKESKAKPYKRSLRKYK